MAVKRFIRHAMLAAALVLLVGSSALDLLQLQEPSAHYYFYAARWLGTGLSLGFLSCAWYWSEPRFDPTLGEKGPGLTGLLMLLFYGASWALRKHDDRHLSSQSLILSALGLLALLTVVIQTAKAWRPTQANRERCLKTKIG